MCFQKVTYFVGILNVTEEKEPDPDPQVRGTKMSSDPEHCKLQYHKSTPQGVDRWLLETQGANLGEAISD